jgi:hypothetical protein
MKQRECRIVCAMPIGRSAGSWPVANCKVLQTANSIQTYAPSTDAAHGHGDLQQLLASKRANYVRIAEIHYGNSPTSIWRRVREFPCVSHAFSLYSRRLTLLSPVCGHPLFGLCFLSLSR